MWPAGRRSGSEAGGQSLVVVRCVRAKDLGLSIGDYRARRVQDDASGLRARGVDAAAPFLAEHQGVFDEAEVAQQTSAGVRAA